MIDKANIVCYTKYTKLDSPSNKTKLSMEVRKEMEDMKSSILQMARGAIQERVDYEVTKVINNILDANTDPKAKRKITLTIEMKPDENRQFISLSAIAKSTLAPVVPIGTTLGIAADSNGEMVIVETVPQVPGQMNMDGGTQEAPKLLKLAAM